ncbi:RNA-binding domain-containing protein [Geminisphaera colitermitum]|uniref:RNA-binding domain-containing protein n=1 Tax=Geminisphaera colitermitum TaxID=1148786 RepID=UPI000158C5C4|nr:RNA-binding domain-containing protein [Geminisphaera colitermitum]
MVTFDDILQAARIGENSDWEFKSASGGLPGSLWETYSAMANTEGGTIVLGVSEKTGQTRLDGLSAEQAEHLRRDLWNTVRNRGKVNIDLLREEDVQVIPAGSTFLILIRVPRASRTQRPVYLNAQPLGNTYRRRHEGDFRCTEEEVRRMFADAGTTPPDYRVLPGFSLADLDPTSLTQYRQRLRSTKGDHPWLALDEQALLEKLGGWRMDRESGQSGLTLAGLLMFGKSEALRDPAALPRFMVDYREKLEPGLRWTDREHPDGTWEGNLFQFYQRVWPKLARGLSVPFKLEDGQRKDETPVHEALREAFVNALIHADHSAPGGVVVERYADRYVFENPGTLLVSFDQFWRGNLSECRNKALQQMFFMIGGGERAGSGVDKIKAGWKSQHWRAPQLETSIGPDRVRLTLLMVSLIPDSTLNELKTRLGNRFSHLSPQGLQALATAHLENSVTNQRLQQLLDDHPTDITYLLTKLCDRGLLVSDGKRRWTRYRLPWMPMPSSSAFPVDSSPKPASSSPKPLDSSLKPTNSSLKDAQPDTWAQLETLAAPVAKSKRSTVTQVRQAILELCSQNFLTLGELAELLKRQPNPLRNDYLSPLVKERHLTRRFPNDINHPQQAYQTLAPQPTPIKTKGRF